ncbi:MAG: VOC family protein, partial [Candidatus Omnitrophota bacterium]|nr:VOC family protein [Candidatus Omnitrophota bacterium]
MKKINKNINIAVIFMLILITYPRSAFCLRTPVGDRGTFYRMSEEIEPGDTQKQLLRKIHFYAQKLEKCNSLSETGKKYLGRLKQTSPESGIEELKDIIAQYPAPETPHLEYFDVGVFKGLSNSDKERIFRLLISLRVTEGCSFGCRHCAGSPSGKVQSMYFFRILAFLDAAKEVGLITLGQSFGTNVTIIPGSITNYEFNEVFDYRCPITGADYGDVVSAMLERFPEQRIYLNTRGWRLGDKHGQQAGEKIARLMKKYPDRVILDVSVDLYSLERGGVEAHIKRMVNIFKTFDGVPIHIRAAYDNNNEEETKLVVGRILSQVDKTYISLAGSRAPVSVLSGSRAGILSDREYDVAACSYGVHILPDGSVRIKIPVVNLSYRHGYVLSSCNAWLDNTGKKLLSGAFPYGARPFNPSDNLSDDLQYSAIYRVKDLSRAVEFYKNKLGFTLLVEDQEEQWAIFLIDEKV